MLAVLTFTWFSPQQDVEQKKFNHLLKSPWGKPK